MNNSNIQRPGFPNASIKLYKNYDSWLQNTYIEMGATFISLTMRDGLYGNNEGLLQVYDITSIHTHMTGDELISVKVGNANTQKSRIRIYSIKHFSVSVDEKGDTILLIQLGQYHHTKNLKFGRTFFSNASETIETMMTALYEDAPLIIPNINGINVYVPQIPWTSTIKDYMSYVRDIGLAVSSDQFAFIWEDFNGLNIMDYTTLINKDPINFIVGDPNLIGMYAEQLKYPIAFNFEWQTKSNSFTRNPITDSTVFAHSFLDQNVTRLTNGAGNNSIMVLRTGGYADMIYRNGYEETIRITTMAQYDGYAKATIYGNFDIMPGMKVEFYDSKNQFISDFYIDEVIHELSAETSYTNMYMFTNSKDLVTTTPIKVKNELKTIATD